MYSWLKNLFPNYYRYRYRYDECVIFCGSADSKEAFESKPQKRVVFLADYDDEAFTDYINKLKEHQLERMEARKAPLNIFIGMDDIVFSQSIGSKGNPSMAERLMLICRHELNASVIIELLDCDAGSRGWAADAEGLVVVVVALEGDGGEGEISISVSSTPNR